ncbi:MAG: 30S ribosomal protein S17 [Candidatus Nanoarchaeia archaeon]
MAKKKQEEKEASKNSECSDKLCPFHGSKPLKLRGRVFKGNVVKKPHGRVTIQFDRMVYVPKYERYEKRTAKLHARLPPCIDVDIGDVVKIAETRPISKTINCVVIKNMTKEK